MTLVRLARSGTEVMGHGLHFRTDWVVILVVQLCLVGCSADYFWDGTEWVWKVSEKYVKCDKIVSRESSNIRIS